MKILVRHQPPGLMGSGSTLANLLLFLTAPEPVLSL
jgi:hypothetical protein